MKNLTNEELYSIEGGLVPLVVAGYIAGATISAGGIAYGIAYAFGELKGNLEKLK